MQEGAVPDWHIHPNSDELMYFYKEHDFLMTDFCFQSWQTFINTNRVDGALHSLNLDPTTIRSADRRSLHYTSMDD